MQLAKLLTLNSLVLAMGAATAYADIDDNALRAQANAMFKPIPQSIDEVRGKPVTAVMKDLGKQLFFDPRLSRSHIISCNTCHNLGTGGSDNVPTSIGHGWQKGPRNSPTVLNSFFNVAQFWDGRAADLAEQAKGPIQAGVEMNNTPERVVDTLNSIPEYVESFKKAFPNENDPVSFDNMAFAIEAFETTLITPDAPIDQFMKGDDNALNVTEKEGLQLFLSSGCISCHSGINFGGQAYFPFGLVSKPEINILPEADKGRFSITNTDNDEYVFRAAPLRNVALTPPYFHSGQIWDLKQAVKVMGTSQLGRELSDDEANKIATFLHALTGKQPVVEYPLLPASTDKTPLPE